jgi:hypothetical protein
MVLTSLSEKIVVLGGTGALSPLAITAAILSCNRPYSSTGSLPVCTGMQLNVQAHNASATHRFSFPAFMATKYELRKCEANFRR